MKQLLITVFLLSSLLMPAAAHAQEADSVTKTYCTSAAGYADVDAMKADLLANAKRLVVNELFGELIAASTSVEDMVVTSDQIRASSMGFVHISGDAEFYNGSSFAEVCVTTNGYVTEKDLLMFEPVTLSNRLCLARPDLSAEALTDFVKSEAIVQALADYDRKLEGADREEVMALMRDVTYSEAGFVQDTATYCATIEGLVTPIEVLAYGTLDATVTGDGKAGTGRSATMPQAGAGSGAVTVDDRRVPDCTTELEFGQIVECAIEKEGEEHEYTFIAEPEDIVDVTISRIDGDLAPGFSVSDKNGKLVTEAWNENRSCGDSGSKSASNYCGVVRSGTHTIVVGSSEADTTGRYRLYIQRMNNPGFATPVEFDTSVTGEIIELHQNDYYTFDAERDDRFTVEVSRVDGDIAPFFNVWDRNGEVVKEADNQNAACEAHDSRVAKNTCVAGLSGQFTVLVMTSESDTTGTYRLTLQKQN